MPLIRAVKACRAITQAAIWPVAPVAAAIALIWAMLLGDLRQEYRDSISGAERETAALVHGLSETTTASLEVVDQTLLDLREAYARDPAHFDLKAWSHARRFSSDLIIQLAVIGPDGILLQSTLPVPEDTNLADREYVRVQMHGTGDEMFISMPVLGRVSNRKSLNITRKIITPDGGCGGVVVVSAGLDDLTRFYEALTTRGVVELVGTTDGRIRARAPGDQDLIGQPEPDIGRMTQPVGTGLLHIASPDDNSGRIISYRRLSKYPLLVLAGLYTSEVLDAYNRDRDRYMLAGTVLSVLFGLFGVILIRQRRTLLASQAALTATLENISQGILMVDAEGRVPVANRRVMDLLSLPEWLMARRPTFKEILEFQLQAQEFGPPGDVDQKFLAFVAEGGIATGYHVYQRVRPDGTTLEVQTQSLPGGGAVRTYTDMTEWRRNEAALAAARDAAEAGSRARAQFITVISHEIRTPLNGILGVAELLQALELSPVAAEYANVIVNSGNHLLAIINDILDFSSLEASRLDLESAPFDVRQPLREAVALLGHQAESKGLALTLRVAENVPPLVLGDAQRLRQIVLNLAGNGIKFTEAGSVRIEVRRIAQEDRCVRLGFSVADTGIGITHEAHGRLFTEFTQVDSSIRRRFGGSGLGLAISRRLVELMDGQISVESVLGQGSTFRFDVRLGIATRKSDVPRPQNPGTAIAGTAPAVAALPEAGSVTRLHILLAEDNATNRFVVTRMLEHLGHTITTVPDGRAAVEALESGRHDLVLMDMMMPEMDGLTAARTIRAAEDGRTRIPIVGLTASAMEADAEACKSAGMDGFLTKPVKIAQLDAGIRAAMQRQVITA